MRNIVTNKLDIAARKYSYFNTPLPRFIVLLSKKGFFWKLYLCQTNYNWLQTYRFSRFKSTKILHQHFIKNFTRNRNIRWDNQNKALPPYKLNPPSNYLTKKPIVSGGASHASRFLASQGKVTLSLSIRKEYAKKSEKTYIDTIFNSKELIKNDYWGRFLHKDPATSRPAITPSNDSCNPDFQNSEFNDFLGAKVALIGPNTNIYKYKEEIDSFDFIAKMGHREISNKSCIKDFLRTDILFLGSGKDYEIELDNPKITYWLPSKNNFRLPSSAQKIPLRDDLHGEWWSGHPLGAIRAILNLLNSGVGEIKVYGIDFYLSDFVSNNPLGVPWISWWWHTWKSHDLISNLIFFKNLIGGVSNLKTTSEIDEILTFSLSHCSFLWERNFNRRLISRTLFSTI